MKPHFWERFKRNWCMRFGHKLLFSHYFEGKEVVKCKRCRVIAEKGVFENEA